MGYSPERKSAVLKRMLPPNNLAIRQLSQDEGISEATLHKWRAEARSKGQLLPDADAGPEGWSSRDKFAAVLETAALNETDLAEYCRKRGLYPTQIAARLRLMHPDDPSQRISHEAIYAAIYAQPRGGLKVLMIEALRQAKPKRGMRRTTLAGSAIVPETLRIIHRPEDIEARLVPGHWEGDLIKGAFNRSAIGTVVERKTRFVILSKMQGCTANAALEGFTRQMKRLPVALRQSMTYDRGSEMACHPELSRRLKIDIWFCDPHAPWQRGSNENTNGLLRQFFPKGTDLSCLSQTALNDVARMMNHRPRKTLGWRTPAEAMAEELAAIKSTVALQT